MRNLTLLFHPPSIPAIQKHDHQPEVKYDPEIALFTDDEKGLMFYEQITNGALNILNENGYLLFELGYGQYKDVFDIMSNAGFKEIEIIKDLAGIERVIKGKFYT